MYTVYRHTTPSGKVYIGLTKQKPRKRWQKGKGYQTQKKFYRAIEKYGWDNIKHEILWQGEDEKEAERLEKRLIEKHNSTNNKFGYNISPGGLYNNEISEETIAKSKASRAKPEYRLWLKNMNEKRWSDPEAHRMMSERFKGERNPMYGTKQSEERQKLAKETLQPYTDKLKKKVMCIENGVVYESISQAARENGISPSSVAQSCRKYGKCKFLKRKFKHFKYVTEEGD